MREVGFGPTATLNNFLEAVELTKSKTLASSIKRFMPHPLTQARARGGVALALAPGVHGVAQIENRRKASTATLRTIIAIATSSMVEYRLG